MRSAIKGSWTRGVYGASLLLFPLLCGCQNDIKAGGPDIKYLEAQPKQSLVADAKNPLLPLAKGNTWDMMAYCQDLKSNTTIKTNDQYVVTGTVDVNGVTSTEVQILRGGGKWRRELYHQNGDSLELVGTQDENSDLMSYSPPIPLFKYPAKEGESQKWLGDFVMRGQKLPGRAQSRISSQENIKTPAGIFKTLRIDTMIVVNQGMQEIKFPSVRWLAPGVGFVRRAYADKGRPATAETTLFKVQ